MYFDFIKQNYLDKSEEEREKYIERDKECLKEIIQENIANDIDNIVERYYRIDDVGSIDLEEKFLDILKEAEKLYYFGFYVGSIAIIGIITEEYSKFLVNKNNLQDEESQIKRIKLLSQNRIITNKQKDMFHKIRKIRNECMHFNPDFKKLKDQELEEKAFQMISMFKECIKEWVNNDIQTDKLIEDVVKSKNESVRSFIYRNRNVIKQRDGVEMQIVPGIGQMFFSSSYYVLEIDIKTDKFKEMTLFDMKSKLPVVVDLTLPQSEMIQRKKIQEGNIIIASLVSQVFKTGMTEEWLLLEIGDIYHEIIPLELLDSIIDIISILEIMNQQEDEE